MAGLFSIIFFLVSAAVSVLGFMSIKSDIQIIIAVLGLLFAGHFLVMALVGAAAGDTKRIALDIEDAIEDMFPKKRKGATGDFQTAVAAFQEHSGEADAASAVRSLASAALRREGFLK